MNAPPEIPEHAHVEQEIADLRVSVRLRWTIGVAVLGSFNSIALMRIVPKIKMIFDDMIPGGGATRPVLTQVVLVNLAGA